MAFALTRSGKGVGLVIPTLLRHPDSAIIHDIKGELWQLTAGYWSRFSHALLLNSTDPPESLEPERNLSEGTQGVARHSASRRRLLMMFDEFPTLGRLDFFEQALAFMAGYGLRAILIAQSLNQIEKAYGPNNSILDNCHVRIAFSTNDERTAKRISDALGTATELRAQRNYAGHRLSPWLGHMIRATDSRCLAALRHFLFFVTRRRFGLCFSSEGI